MTSHRQIRIVTIRCRRSLTELPCPRLVYELCDGSYTIRIGLTYGRQAPRALPVVPGVQGLRRLATQGHLEEREDFIARGVRDVFDQSRRRSSETRTTGSPLRSRPAANDPTRVRQKQHQSIQAETNEPGWRRHPAGVSGSSSSRHTASSSNRTATSLFPAVLPGLSGLVVKRAFDARSRPPASRLPHSPSIAESSLFLPVDEVVSSSQKQRTTISTLSGIERICDAFRQDRLNTCQTG
ncbi:uncharacterized protein LOC111253171 isoform X2 [Varroa destructor]|uniref:Uncharacterized protein n=1 Tax=Varroa destructor TaxID=109461 RepID=A0A7M7MDA5_VARDE|nr:uncharacterized protein LOC111253171 isoform X2 [Varroa destructor]